MSEIISPDKVKRDDKMIALIGPTGCGKSNFIDHLTKSTTWSKPDLKPTPQNVRAVRIHLFNTSIVLVDTPGFDDDTYGSDDVIVGLIGKWLQKTYQRDIKLSGILYLHKITDNRMAETAFRSLRMFGKLCGENPADKVIFVTTMWDNISKDKGEEREEELRKTYWRPMIELGAQTARFLQNNQDCAQNIVKRLIESITRATVQEETADTTVETEAAKTLFTQMQTLLAQQKVTAAELREAARKVNNPQLLVDLEKEEARLQAELDKTFKDTRKLRMPLTRRIKLFLSPKAKPHAN